MTHAHHLFYKKDLCKNETIIKAGVESLSIYIICSGQVSLYKRVKSKNITGEEYFKLSHVLDICVGDMFGEDKLFYGNVNKYTIKVTSLKTSVYYCSLNNFRKNFYKAWPMMLQHFKTRDFIIENQVCGIDRNL